MHIPGLALSRHREFVQGLKYFYIFFAIGKQGIAERAGRREARLRTPRVTVSGTIACWRIAAFAVAHLVVLTLEIPELNPYHAFSNASPHHARAL